MPSTLPLIEAALAAPYPDGPHLLADIGGTNARFALECAPGRIEAIRVLPCAAYPELVDAIDAYLALSGQPSVLHAAIAIANPVQGDQIKMTNHAWAFSIEATRRRLRLDTLLVVNDFTALAMALPHLGTGDLQQIGGGRPVRDGVVGLVGAGTGLGVGGLVPSAGRWTALASEGGHVTFSPADEREMMILRHCWKTYAHVSAERLVSGPGIELVYQALAADAGVGIGLVINTGDIVRRALDGSDALARATLDCFCGMLGTVAGNVAVTLGTAGGLYIGGGVVRHLGTYFATSPFRARFESKGRFSTYLAQIPTCVITAPYPAFIGVAAILSEHRAQPATR